MVAARCQLAVDLQGSCYKHHARQRAQAPQALGATAAAPNATSLSCAACRCRCCRCRCRCCGSCGAPARCGAGRGAGAAWLSPLAVAWQPGPRACRCRKTAAAENQPARRMQHATNRSAPAELVRHPRQLPAPRLSRLLRFILLQHAPAGGGVEDRSQGGLSRHRKDGCKARRDCCTTELLLAKMHGKAWPPRNQAGPGACPAHRSALLNSSAAHGRPFVRSAAQRAQRTLGRRSRLCRAAPWSG